MEKNMGHYMETEVIKGRYRDPSMQIIPKLGFQVRYTPKLGYLDPQGIFFARHILRSSEIRRKMVA